MGKPRSSRKQFTRVHKESADRNRHSTEHQVNIPRPIQRDPRPSDAGLKPAEFAKVLIKKLEFVLRDQECRDKNNEKIRQLPKVNNQNTIII